MERFVSFGWCCATTEIPSLGGEVCISTDANHNKDNVMAISVSIIWDMPMKPVEGQWTIVAGHVYDDESIESDIPCFNPAGQAVELTVLEGSHFVGGVTNILADGSQTAPTVKWQARAYKLPPVNEDGFGGARYISAVDVFIPRTINYQYNTQLRIQLLVDAVNALTERFGEDLVLVVGPAGTFGFEGRVPAENNWYNGRYNCRTCIVLWYRAKRSAI